MSYRTKEAYEYYTEHILKPLKAKTPIYQDKNIPMEGLVPFRDWEVMIAIFVDDRGSALRSGSDLMNHEVKSVLKGGSFEYQYHREHGEDKLDHDLEIEHLLIEYHSGYESFDVYALSAEQFAAVAEGWRKGLRKAYGPPNPQQRYRRNFPRRKVLKEGRHVMRVRNGNLQSIEAETALFK